MTNPLPLGLSFPYPFPKALPYSRFARVSSRSDPWSVRGALDDCREGRLRALNAARGTSFPEPDLALEQVCANPSLDLLRTLSQHPDEGVLIAVVRFLAPASGRMGDLSPEAAPIERQWSRRLALPSPRGDRPSRRITGRTNSTP